MTTDPSREAFEKTWRADDKPETCFATGWQAATAHKELESAIESVSIKLPKPDAISHFKTGALLNIANKVGPWYSAGTVRALLQAAMERKTDGWQPIVTAPKDGVRILLAGPNGRIAVGFYDAGDGGWFWPQSLAEPTHWMPLPAAPLPQGE